MGNRALHDPERSLEIDIKNGFNGAGGDFMQRCETVADPGIIAQNVDAAVTGKGRRSEEHTSELQSLMRISYAVFCLKKKTKNQTNINIQQNNNHIQMKQSCY